MEVGAVPRAELPGGYLARGKKQKQQEDIERQQLIKKLVIIAMFSDDDLMDRLVLKGGNAIDLLYRVSARIRRHRFFDRRYFRLEPR
ncbi:MAG TPA: hypothetical protein VFE47_25225 [Tepidisphaeraceae bacterium]|nr:hypothetical protein [Tepidisphaeraceae bacterium]